MLSYIHLHSSIAVTIVAKLSSINIISLASFVTSVQVIHIDTPISAYFNAGASFTPSQVIDTVCHIVFKILTICLLCLGLTLANTQIDSINFLIFTSLKFSNSIHSIAAPDIPSSLAIALAVTILSQVIITTLIPAL
jgi:hypothetical protein